MVSRSQKKLKETYYLDTYDLITPDLRYLGEKNFTMEKIWNDFCATMSLKFDQYSGEISNHFLRILTQN